MQGKCRQSCCHFSTGLTAAFHGSGHLSARPFSSTSASSSSSSPPPPPLVPLSVSIEGELAPCIEPSGYLFNIVTNEAFGEIGEIDGARSSSVGRSARFLSRKAKTRSIIVGLFD